MEELIRSIVKFDGARNNDVVEWLHYIEEVFDREQLQASHKYIAVSYFLTNDAAIWFRHNQSNIPDWFTFKREIIEAFPSSPSSFSSRLLDRYQVTVKEEPQKLGQEPDVLHVLALDSTGQTINFSSPPSSLFELDPFEALWPNGTELWHIHEIRPQRQSFANRIDPEPLMITEHILVECKNQPVERALQSNQNVLEFAPKVDQISFLPVKLTTHLHDVVDVHARLRKPLQSPKTMIDWDVLELNSSTDVR